MPQRSKTTGARKKWGTTTPGKHMAKQAFKDECDINRVLDRAKHGASMKHLLNHQGTYGDFSDFDENTYNSMLNQIADAKTVFNDLPAELRSEFGNNPGRFFEFVNDPANVDQLDEIFPSLQAPGRQLTPTPQPVPVPEPAPEPAPEAPVEPPT